MERYIHPDAKIGKNCEIGPFTVIHESAVIGDECRIGSHVVIYPGTNIGRGVRIDDHTVIGKLPMKAKMSAITKEKKLEPAIIGDHAIIGTSVTIYAGCRIGRNVLVADYASVREDCIIGDGTIIGRGVTVENRVTIGRFCKIETEAYITALSEIGDYCFVSPEVTFTNDNFMGRTKDRFKYHKGVTMKRGARVGANATILPGLIIEEDGVVAAGSVVTRNVPAGVIVMGSPARYFRDVPEEQLLKNQDFFIDEK